MGRETEIDLHGECFFCLTKLMREFPPSTKVKLEVDEMVKSSSGPDSPPSYSLRYLFLYLNMDKGKVFQTIEDDKLSRDNLSHKETSKLTAQLCADCAKLNEKFTGLCRRLEKIQIEVKSCLSLINGKLLDADTEKSRGNSDRKVEIVKELRRETMLQCSRKSTKSFPRVKLTRVKIKNVRIRSYPNNNELANSDNLEMDIKTEVISDPDLDLEDITHEDDDKVVDGLHNPEMKVDGDHRNKSKRRQKRQESVQAGQTIANRHRYRCNQCEKTFMNPNHISRHRLTAHHGVRFQCTVCLKSFSQKNYLKSHVRTFHFHAPNFKCDQCGRGFAQKGHLQTHLSSKLISCSRS